jgi:hypothetical protein
MLDGMSARRALHPVLAIVFHLSACADAPPHATASREPIITDSAGVRTVLSHEPRWRPGEEWTVATEPELRIGMVDGPGEYLFDRIRGVTRLSDGTIVVLNSGDGQVRYYTRGGTHLRSVGRSGAGPGEMRGGRWLDRLDGDVVQVTHAGGRLRYAADGTLLADDRLDWSRIHRLGRLAGVAGSAGFLMESCSIPAPLFLGDAVLLCGSTYTDVRFMPDRPGVYESTSLVALSDWPLEALDTIGIYGRGGVAMYMQGGRLHAARFGPPFAPGVRMRVSGSPARFVVTPADAYRIEVHSFDVPRQVVVMERTGGLRRPTDFELDGFDRAFRGEDDFGGQRVRMRPAGDAGAFRSQVAPTDSLSVVTAAPWVDALGAVWVPLGAEPDAQTRMYDVFDAGGIYLGQISVPRLWFTIREIGADYIVGVTSDELGVEYVTMYRLDRGPPHRRADVGR